ncbi:MAG: hypothetical protein NC489_14250 [Ruminococcus flavefaciens]|nr:hypothetical protein [Ruminococcus flavefaciens]
MNILVFKTVNLNRMKKLLEHIDVLNNDFYIVVPQDEISYFESFNTNIHYISTKKAYMNCDTLIKENKIPNIMFHEIWILSSSYDVRYSYKEVYATVSHLKYSKIVYAVINGEEILYYNIGKEIDFSGSYYLMENIVRICVKLHYLYEKKIRGYKW